MKGGVSIRDFMIDTTVLCRGERLRLSDVIGRKVEAHNQSFMGVSLYYLFIYALYLRYLHH